MPRWLRTFRVSEVEADDETEAFLNGIVLGVGLERTNEAPGTAGAWTSFNVH